MTVKEKETSNWLDPRTTAENEVLPWYFKPAWSSRGLSLALNVLLMGQLTYYCTDMLGMTPLLVGTLLLASKIFDGVTDLFVGFIIDKTHTRFGKARPYEIFIVFLWLLTIVLYSAPNLGTTGLCVFVFILFTLINSVCSTFLNGGDAVYLARSVRSEKNRISVMSFNGAVIMICSIAVGIVMPQLIDGIGSTRSGWTMIACLFGIPFSIIGMFRFIFIKEVTISENEEQHLPEGTAKETIPLKQSLYCVFHNQYIWILAGMTFVIALLSSIGTATNVYYFKYIVGNIGLASLVTMCNIVTPFILALFPLLSKKLGHVRLIKIGAVIGIIGYAVRTIGGTGTVTLAIGSLLSGIGILPVTMMINIYLIDCMDYGEWKTGVRVEGMLSSVNSFMNKLGSGIASGLVGVIMGWAGYNGTLAVQTELATRTIIALFNYVPLALMVVLLILAVLYRLDRQMPQIKQDLTNAKHEI